MSAQLPTETAQSKTDVSTYWRYTSYLCIGVIVLSVLSCVAIAASRSMGLTEITITALDQDAEPRDHKLPLVAQQEALPDYRVTVNANGNLWGTEVELGSKPNESAIKGLTWKLPSPISTADITSIRLDEQDKLITDAIAEVQLNDLGDANELTKGNYRFQFETKRFFSVGVYSFFKTPIGMMIAFAFFIAVLLTLLGAIL